MKAILLLTSIAAFAQDYGEMVLSRKALCCPGGFSAQTAMTTAQRLVAGQPQRVKVVLVTNDKPGFGRIGGSHMSYEQLRDRWLSERKYSDHLAMLIEVPDGVAFDSWSNADGTYVRRTLKGQSPFRLSGSIELLGVVEYQSFVQVFCASRKFEDRKEEEMAISRLSRWFPGRRVVMSIGDVPAFPEALLALPLTPSLALSWAPEKEPLSRTIRFGPQ